MPLPRCKACARQGRGTLQPAAARALPCVHQRHLLQKPFDLGFGSYANSYALHTTVTCLVTSQCCQRFAAEVQMQQVSVRVRGCGNGNNGLHDNAVHMTAYAWQG